MSRIPGPVRPDPFASLTPGRTPGPLGRNDAADPLANAHPGDTRSILGVNDGAVYPLLTAMEKRGLVEGTWEDPQKRTRRIYSLTPAGHEELERLKEVIRPKLEAAISVLRDLCDDLEID